MRYQYSKLQCLLPGHPGAMLIDQPHPVVLIVPSVDRGSRRSPEISLCHRILLWKKVTALSGVPSRDVLVLFPVLSRTQRDAACYQQGRAHQQEAVVASLTDTMTVSFCCVAHECLKRRVKGRSSRKEAEKTLKRKSCSRNISRRTKNLKYLSFKGVSTLTQSQNNGNNIRGIRKSISGFVLANAA